MDRIIEVKKENVGHGEAAHLNGMASYKRVFDRFITDAVLCNNITEVDPEIFYNQETGFYTYEELYNDKLEELKEDYKEELKENPNKLEELESEAETFADNEQYNYEFYQYFIIDLSGYSLELLKELNQHTLQIMYSEKLDVYILGVGHWGTSWDYIGSDFKLKIKE
jgi:hypothetical protein